MISPYSLTIPGGVQNQILGLARALRRLGVDVRVLGPCDGPPPDAGVTPLGNSLPTAANGSVAPLAPDPSAQLRTIRALRDENFDVLHVHEPLAPGPTITAVVLKQAPIVATYHRSGESRSYHRLNRLARWVARRVDVSCAVSEDARATAQGPLGGTYEMVFNGVDLRLYGGDRAPAVPPAILFVGRHEPRKGLTVLLDAMAALPDDVQLWIASDGPQTDELRRRSDGDDRLTWLGRISEVEKADRLRRAAVFCAPSLGGESFGVVLLEAMAAGATVVASDIAGYARVARRDVDALLAPPGDAVALAAALRSALTDESLATRLRASGRARAESFSMERLALRYIELYERALATVSATPIA